MKISRTEESRLSGHIPAPPTEFNFPKDGWLGHPYGPLGPKEISAIIDETLLNILSLVSVSLEAPP